MDEKKVDAISSNDESTSNVFSLGQDPTILAPDNDLGDHIGNPYTFGCQTKEPNWSDYSKNSDTFGVQANNIHNNEPACIDKKDCSLCEDAVVPYCHVKLDSLDQLKDSTRKLLVLLEEIQINAYSNQKPPSGTLQQISSVYHSPILNLTEKTIKSDTQPRSLDTVDCEVEADDCSIYKRLTRKCHCLNQFEYNDFIIHFNETTKYFTSTIGEIIKNLRIVKKFVYMGGIYTKHALMFLNEGLTYSTHSEKLDIIQGCAYADVCNVFDDQSIVIVCIAWPCNDEAHGDTTTQSLAATFLNKLAQIEEGRRYLKFSSKITNDLKKVVRKKSRKMEFDTLESINDTLNLMQPPIIQHTNVSYYCKPAKEGFGSRTANSLIQFRANMTLEEVYTHLDLLNNLSNNDNGKLELNSFLPKLLKLFKCLLMEYDDSEMNIIITNIINNIVTQKMVNPREPFRPVVTAEIATEPILKKNQINQVPERKLGNSVKLKSKQQITPPSRFRQTSKIKNSGWNSSVKKFKTDSGWNSSVKKFKKEPNYSVIIVPVNTMKTSLKK